MTSLPTINGIQVATVPLPGYLARLAAIQASIGTANPLPEVDFTKATVIVGDNNGNTQSISTVQNNQAVTHEVWSGQCVQGVTQDPTNSQQFDILCVIPAVDANDVEIGPFWMTEFIVTDENGVPAFAGVTAMPKYVTANGSTTDVAFFVSGAFSAGTVALAAPAGAFATLLQVRNMINADQVTAVAPIVATQTVDQSGMEHTAISVSEAVQPASDTTGAGWDAADIGVGRPATAAEFAAGAPDSGGFLWPWPTLQQIYAALAAIRATIAAIVVPVIPAALAPLFFNAGSNSYGVNTATTGALGVGRAATTAEAQAGVTAPSTPSPAFITPEDLASGVAAQSGPGVNVGQFADVQIYCTYGYNPGDCGFSLGNNYAASQLQSAVFPYATSNVIGGFGLNGTNWGEFGSVATPCSAILGTVTGTWKLVGWLCCAEAVSGGYYYSTHILRFVRVL